MRRASYIVVLGLFSLPLIASDVYRSVDPQGNVVYSDRPEDGSAVQVAINTAAPATPVVAARRTDTANTAAAQEPDAATVTAAERVQLAQERAANCETARQQNEAFATQHRLYRTDENGERVYFSDTELSQARMNAQAEVSRWCN